MSRGPNIRPRDMAAIQRELGPVVVRLQQIADEHGVTVGTILKHVKLPKPFKVIPVPVKGLDDWNERIASR
jgi:hypothetical protein